VVKCRGSEETCTEVRLAPEETYEAVFPFKITKKFVDKVLSRSIESAGYKEQIQQLQEPKDQA
jgi:hypothetical protein